MIVHLVDGTYELFRHFYGIRRALGKVSVASMTRTLAAGGFLAQSEGG